VRSFFERDAAALEEQPDRRRHCGYGALCDQLFANLYQRDIRVFLDKSQNEPLMRVQFAATLWSLFACLPFAVITPGAMPSDRSCYSDAETCRSLVPGQPAVNRIDHSLTKV
jgi:hypothetical protein